MHVSTLFTATALLQGSLPAYNIVQDYSGSAFFDGFDFFTDNDPTHGYVNYVDRATAEAQGLINTNNNVAYIGVDNTNTASGRGRNSVRLSSKASFTRGLVVIQLDHMPNSQCGSWPAFWTLGPNWPNNGEIDIIEGVNNQMANFMTLHTSPNCAVTDGASGKLQPFSQNCDTQVNGNEGCSFHETDQASYGNGLNGAGGAIYAMEWTSAGISVWWWNGGNPAPGDVLGANPDPSTWGPPTSQWAGAGCVWDEHFANHNIVFDITFCGDWAGSSGVFDQMCPGIGSCTDYVANSPGDFKDTYWSVPSLMLYSQDAALVGRDFENAMPSANQTLIQEQVKRCVDAGLCQREAEPEPAAASQAHPAHIAKASQTVNPKVAVANAEAASGHVKRAAASQAHPADVPKASQTVDPKLAVSRAKKGGKADQDGQGKDKRSSVGRMSEIRRRRYAQ